MTRGYQQQQQQQVQQPPETLTVQSSHDNLVPPGGGRQQCEAEGHGREAHAQLIPEEHVGPDRGD